VAVGLGAAGCGAVLGLHAAGAPLPVPSGGTPPATVAGAAALAAALTAAVRRLGAVDRAALSAGAEVAAAASGSALLLDPTLLSGVLAARRWRRIATVTSRRLGGGRRWPGRRWLEHLGGGQRWPVLLRADLQRPLRRPGLIAGWAVLMLVPYAAELIAPAWPGPVRILAGYLAADRMAGGLRTVCRSAALRRTLGGTDTELTVVHLVLPGVALAVWWAATAGAVTGGLGTFQALLAAGVLAAVYRAAGRRPISYSGMAVDTPLGMLPLDLIMQLLRGPDVLAAVVLVNAVAGGR
jgi:hypothetical protein